MNTIDTTQETEHDVIAQAREFGIDVDQIRIMVRMSPNDRIKAIGDMEENLRFIKAAKPGIKRKC